MIIIIIMKQVLTRTNLLAFTLIVTRSNVKTQCRAVNVIWIVQTPARCQHSNHATAFDQHLTWQ